MHPPLHATVSCQFLCTEHECDSQIAKLALVFSNYNLKETYVYIMKCMQANTNGLWLIPVKRQVIDYLLDLFACTAVREHLWRVSNSS